MATPRKMVRDSLGFASSQFLVRAMMIVRTVIAARLLGPQTLGVWNALQLVMDYGSLAPVGTQHGLDQVVPRRIAAGDPVALERVKRAGITSILILTLLFCSGWMAFFFNSSGNMLSYWGPAGLALAMLVMLLINWANYHTTLLRSHGNITAVSGWFFLQGLIGAVLGLALIRPLGGWGLLWGWTAGTAVAFLWTRWEARRIAPLRPLIAQETLDLLRVGFPMYFFVGSSLIIRNLDRLIILRYLGTRDLGLYSLAVTALTLLMYLPDSATYVFYPRLLQRFHAGGDQPAEIRTTVINVLRLLTVLTPVLGGIAFFFVRGVIITVLPNYEPGIAAIRIMCFTAGAVCIGNLCSIVLMTLGRQIWLIPVAAVSIVAFAAADLLVLRAGYGITGVAWATLATYTASGTLILTLALTALGLPAGRVVKVIALSLWGLVVAVGMAPLIDRFTPWTDTPGGWHRIAHAMLGSGIFLVLYGLLVGPQLRGLGMRQVIADLNLPLPAWLNRALNTEATSS